MQKKKVTWPIQVITVNLTAIAEEFHLSETYVSRLIKQKTGKTFGEHVQTIRLKKARTLLRNTTMTVETIAQSVGYPSVEHFNRIFKKTYQLTPVQYRNAV